MDFWLDPWEAKKEAFVSHAHADHFSRHEKAYCSTLTGALLTKRFHMAEGRLETAGFGAIIEKDGFRMRLLPAGHIVGSAMLHVTRKSDGSTLLYTGDFKVRRGRTAEMVNFMQADVLIMETTFGLPHLVFPPQMEVEARVLRFVNDAFDDGEMPILFAYSLGKAQEAIALLAENGIPVLSHPKVAEMTEVSRAAGVRLPEPVIFDGVGRPGHVVIGPPNAVASKLLRGAKNKRTAMLTGWAMQPGSFYRYKVDEVIPLSDHADYPGLMECITRVRPKRVLTVHGFSKEFAAELRGKGIDAWSALGGDQMELSLGKPTGAGVGASAPRKIRPICQLADFSDVCNLISETSSRLAKVDFLKSYFQKLDTEEDLKIATRWFTGEALPRVGGRRTLNIGSATLKRAILMLPGVKPERYREISATQNDLPRTARILLQEILLQPLPMTLVELYDYFKELSGALGSLEKVESLADRFQRLHPTEVEVVNKLLTGDLRIGLKEGLVEEAVAAAFGAKPTEVRQANMLTGDLGETACLAKAGDLSSAKLTPMVPIRCMLAAPLERNEESDLPEFGNLPFAPPFWFEPKYDGIRAQLHKEGDKVGLFSRDLRPLDQEFPELIEEAAKLKGDFVLDGELIAYAKGRKLGFSDLQKRLGRTKVEGDLFLAAGQGAGVVPLKYVAFDLLWADQIEYLEKPLRERRAKLDSLGLEGMVECIGRYSAEGHEEIDGLFKRSLKDGHEGLIAKDPESNYAPGRRGKHWIKLKGVMPTLDCVVVYAEQGHGKRAGVLSDYTFAIRDHESGELRVLGKAYSGLTDLEIERLTEHFLEHTISKARRKHRVEPDTVLEIAFDSIRRSPRHDSGLALRFPRIKSIRTDKGLGEIDTLQTAMNLLKK
ncbi:ATP-dependent DNA ligase [Luteolibacter sp. AS25]|uniref:ATP-dependent DNA ligase n=1 Tax=Luteolibacter sp. AS25 TaxID=3135776 RepID=UPI00398B4382